VMQRGAINAVGERTKPTHVHAQQNRSKQKAVRGRAGKQVRAAARSHLGVT